MSLRRPMAIVTGDFRQVGGTDRANYELAWHLAEREGAETHLVSYRLEGPLAGHRNVRWHRVPKPLNSYTLAEPVQDYYGRRVAREVTARGGRVIVNGGNCLWPDVNWVHAVHAAWPNRDAHAPARFRLRNAMAKRAFRWREGKSLRAARLVIANSQRTRDDVVRLIGVPSERVRVVYLGVDAARDCPPSASRRAEARQRLEVSEEAILVAFAGVIGRDRNKGFDVVFEAVASLIRPASGEAGAPWHLIAAGDGAEVPFWRGEAERRGLTGRIRLLGPTDRVPDLLDAADVFVAPSHYEAFGLAVQEALCHGVPALVSRCAGVSEVYPEALRGLLIDNPSDPSALAAQLQVWRANRLMFAEAAVRLSGVLRARTWEVLARDIVQAIQST